MFWLLCSVFKRFERERESERIIKYLDRENLYLEGKDPLKILSEWRNTEGKFTGSRCTYLSPLSKIERGLLKLKFSLFNTERKRKKIICSFLRISGKSRFPPKPKYTRMWHFKSNEQFKSIVLLEN